MVIYMRILADYLFRYHCKVQDIVKNCDYTIEANKIAKADHFGDISRVNTADAAVFFQMGYEQAISEINKRLIPITFI